MTETLRPCWRNCYAEEDPRWREDGQLSAIDAMEDGLGPLDAETEHIRWLITAHESCHHKAERHVELIVEAIGAGRTEKGPGRRAAGPEHEREKVWRDCCEILSGWRAGSSGEAVGREVGGVAAGELVGFMGKATPLKVWQVERVVEKIQTYIDPETRWGHIDVVEPRAGGPEAELVELTRRAVIHDTVDGAPAELTLAHAIDFLKPCNWNFVGNLGLVLRAIGGDLHPEEPFAHCDRNIKLTPIRERMRAVSNSLRAWWEGPEGGAEEDSSVSERLGERTPVKQWLSASLEKTLRVQLGL